MPKTKIDYSKTIIYKIINYDCPDLVYVGSTTNFTKRKQQHKSQCYNVISKSHDYKMYKTIRENGDWGSWNMIKICDYPCNDNHEAKLEEDKHMMELKANMNMIRASRTIEQWRKDNKDNLKERRKQYSEDNTDKIKDKMKQYQDDNKDKIKERKSKKCTCECGTTFIHGNKARHIKTIKHQKY
jgi:predicted GIY-YIG superfamily endonuclease